MSATTTAPNTPTLFENHTPTLVLLAAAFVVMFAPVYYGLSQTAWATDSNGHGPIILGLVLWLLWREREATLQASTGSSPVWGLFWVVIGGVAYVLGHSQGIDTIEALAQIPILIGCLLLVGGRGSLRQAWFPIFFLCFMVPLPGVLTQMITLPLKAAVSFVAEGILHWAGFPVGRAGVTLVIGPYQLLVADACSGLNSIFTLESLGLFYMKLMNYQSRLRNVVLATVIIPISFASNVVRVMCLILITYYFGDRVGQGFMHGFAGMLLFGVALILMFAFDWLLARHFDKPSPTTPQALA